MQETEATSWREMAESDEKLKKRKKLWANPRERKKIVDQENPLWNIGFMKKHLCKVDKSAGAFRVAIPKKLIQKWRWGNVTHVMVERDDDGAIKIRRFLDEEALKKSDKKGPPKGYRPPRSR